MAKPMKSHRWSDFGILIAAVAVTRFAFRSRYLYDLDSVNFALALEKFDPGLHQPHPPGYFLYVMLGRLAASLFADPNTSLVAISIIASCGAAAATYLLADAWFGRRAAVFAGLIFVLSPLGWFHGIVALTYIVEAFFAALVGYFCWQTYSGRHGFVLPSAIALGLAAGFRQSSILFLGPLWLLSLHRVPRRRAGLAVAALGLTALAWFIPMALESGGLERYVTALYTQWSAVPAQKTAFAYPVGESVALAVARFATILFIFFLCFGGFALTPLLHRRSPALEHGKKLFLWTWLTPGLVFFTFIYLIFVNSGYLLVLTPPLFAWLGAKVADWCAETPARPWPKAALLASFAVLNVSIFLYGPFYCSYGSVRRFESELDEIRLSIRNRFSPAEAIIVGFDSHFLGFRHAGFYLPEFLTLAYPESMSLEGKRVYSIQGSQTQLLSEVPAERYQDFVLFPLPESPLYEQYLEGVTGRFPDRTLQSVTSGNRDFLVGTTSSLHYLFPSAAPAEAATCTNVNGAR